METYRRRSTLTAGLVAGICSLMLLAACSTEPSPQAATDSGVPAESSSSAGDETAGVPVLWSGTIDPTALPLGDGKVSAEPEAGSLYSCKTEFGGRGAPNGGPWIDEANGTWDATSKAQVEGSNSWPQATYAESVDSGVRRITASNLPTEHVTGNFPIATSDPAYQYDRNPNEIDEKVIDLSLPAEPVAAAEPSCVPMGAIGVLKNGVYIFNSLDAAGADAAAHETQDVCDGHPDGGDFYHFHNIPSCLLDAAGTSDDGSPMPRTSTLVGYALDGFGIYVERDSTGSLPTNADLDECHGRTSTVLFNGMEQNIFHYSATLEYPYTVGCFLGTPVAQPSHAH